MPVEIVHFNPRRKIVPGPLGYMLPRRPLNNFGDLIGPILVARIAAEMGLQEPSENRRLVVVGSIMKLTRPGDVVWGAGINGKSMDSGAAPLLDVRAVRGPRTRERLLSTGMNVPPIYGDPALLWARYWTREWYVGTNPVEATHPVSVIPNFHDYGRTKGDGVINPLQHPHDVIRRIAMSEFVCGSSLHGIVLAESFGIPARLVRSDTEPGFKYDDYYAGTGRESYAAASTVQEAIEMGGERPPAWDPEALLGAFPVDLYRTRDMQ